MVNKKCPKCGSENLDRGRIGPGVVGYTSHNQRFLSNPVGPIDAEVCLDCGYTELYVNVEKLKEKLKK
jgi:predicted nucleic-acid-binding Zn-ribbon protein